MTFYLHVIGEEKCFSTVVMNINVHFQAFFFVRATRAMGCRALSQNNENTSEDLNLYNYFSNQLD